jgi:hypothetical protein
MDGSDLTRRRLLAGAAVAGAGTVTYAVDNPIHRSTSVSTAERTPDRPIDPGYSWAARFDRRPAPDAKLAQLVGVRYAGVDEDDDAHVFSVVAVAAGRRTGLLGGGPLLSEHRLGIRGVGDSTTVAADEGTAESLTAGVVLPPGELTGRTGLSRDELDDPAVVVDRVGRDGAFGTEPELASVRALLDGTDVGEATGSDHLTLGGILYGLGSATTDPAVPTPEFQGRGERYRVPLDGVFAHAVHYRGLSVHPGDEGVALKAASAVPRPSLLGAPTFRDELVVSVPP